MLGRPKRFLNIVIDDYCIRFLESTSKNLSSIKKMNELALPLGLIENGKIVDEIAFYEFMKNLVKETGIKNRYVRFYAPNSLVIMRHIDIPAHLKGKEVKEFVRDEIGKSIHLPFKKPVFDIHYPPNKKPILNDESANLKQEVIRATMFAAPKEEMQKYTEIFADVSLKPVAADVQALGIFRYFNHTREVKQNHAYLFVELNVGAIDISIFKNNELEFLRYQTLDLQLDSWQVNEEINEIQWHYVQDEMQILMVLDDLLLELERILNFYQFSIKKGEEQIDKIIVLGDHPFIAEFYNKVNKQFEIPVKELKGYISRKIDEKVAVQYIPALGLALKGGSKHDS